jgi:hypothetical protein
MPDTARAEAIVEMMRAQLAECEEMIARGVARPGTAEHVDTLRTLLATFAARNDGLGGSKVLAHGERGRDWGSA